MASAVRKRPILALDLGTTQVKAAVVEPDGRVSALASRRCAATAGPRALVDATALLAAAEDALREAATGAVDPLALALSCAMHGAVPVAPDETPLGPLSTFADPVGGAHGRALREAGRALPLHARTGTPVHPSSWVCRLPALRAELAPATRERLAGFRSAKELLLWRWCGARVVDESLASATGLCDADTGDWDPEALALAGLDRAALPGIVPIVERVGPWRPGVAAGLGLPADLPVVIGASDGACAHLGVGGDEPGVASLSFGTSGAARRAVDVGQARALAGALAARGLFRYRLDAAAALVGGAVSHVGRALEWAAGLFWPGLGPDAAVAALLDEAARADPRGELPDFDPRLSGERFPEHDLDAVACGAFTGLGYAHGRAELQAAVVAGIVGSVARIVEACDGVLGPATAIRGGGGLLRAPLVAQRLADRLRRTVEIAASVESSAIGAARLARRALGLDDPSPFRAERCARPR
ncbi:MAG: hypothetical protein IPM29_23330 [Planctomycetes bacterium]|nr:hypothetical protein [Planctomycetota bacterium]